MNIKYAFSFILGAGIGSGVTYILAKRHFDDLADKEIDEIKRAYSPVVVKPVEDVKMGEIMVEEEEKPEKMVDISTNYSQISKKYATDEPKYAEIRPSGDSFGPYLISVTEYEELNGNDKVELVYFEEDDVLMKRDDSIFEDGMRLVGGAENLEMLENSEDGVIYIRNDKAGCDYEISREDGSYARYAADIYGDLNE